MLKDNKHYTIDDLDTPSSPKTSLVLPISPHCWQTLGLVSNISPHRLPTLLKKTTTKVADVYSMLPLHSAGLFLRYRQGRYTIHKTNTAHRLHIVRNRQPQKNYPPTYRAQRQSQ